MRQIKILKTIFRALESVSVWKTHLKNEIFIGCRQFIGNLQLSGHILCDLQHFGYILAFIFCYFAPSILTRTPTWHRQHYNSSNDEGRRRTQAANHSHVACFVLPFCMSALYKGHTYTRIAQSCTYILVQFADKPAVAYLGVYNFALKFPKIYFLLNKK